MKKFFNLPTLHTYLVALILLIALIYNGSSLVRSGIYYAFSINQPTYQQGDDGRFTFTTDAQEYFKKYSQEANQNGYLRDIVSSGLTVALFLPFFALYWLRGKKIDEDNTVPFTVKNFYFYLVCIITLFIALFSASSAINTITAYKYPNFYVSSISDLASMNLNGTPREKIPPQATPSAPSSEPKTVINAEKLKKSVEEQNTQYRNNQIRPLIDQITLAIIAIPILLLHWFRIRKLGLTA